MDYLRVSITDRCNERCLYCMPEGYKGWTRTEEHLSAAEIVHVVEEATRIGFRKIRITGGEPLLRSDVMDILSGVRALPGVETLGLSTNGTRLEKFCPDLKRVGIDSINVSLDALDPVNYQKITGGNLVTVLRGLDAVAEADFCSLKLNCVLLRGVNETEFESLIRFAADRALPLRFIELMPLSRTDVLNDKNFLPVRELMQRLADRGALAPADSEKLGNGPARYFSYLSPGMSRPAKLGFIGSITTEHFCESCNKIRLTADGKLRPCLGRSGEIDLRDRLRTGGEALRALRDAVAAKPENHEFLDNYQPGRPMTAIGG